jgi:hypothetical protein
VPKRVLRRAEHLWMLTNEALVNQYCADIDALEAEHLV